MNELIRIPKANTNAKVGIIILALKVILSYTGIGKYVVYLDDALSILAVFYLAVSMLKKQYSIRSLFLYAIIALLGLITSRYVGNVMLFITILAILALKKETKVIYLLMKYEAMIVVIAACWSIIIGNHLCYDSELKRYLFDFGFSHPNLISCIIFNILIMWLWVNYHRLNKRIYTLSALFLLSVFLMTNSRTMLFLGYFTILLLAISQNKAKIVQRVLMINAKYIVPSLSLFFYYTCISFDEGNRIISQLNKLLTNRIKLGAYAYSKYGFSFLGQVVEKNTEFGYDASWNMSRFIAFDNLYTSLMINYGVIWLIIISISFYLLARKGNKLVNCMIIVWAIYGITESHGINGFLCFPILLISFLLEKDINDDCINEF